MTISKAQVCSDQIGNCAASLEAIWLLTIEAARGPLQSLRSVQLENRRQGSGMARSLDSLGQPNRIWVFLDLNIQARVRRR